MGNQADRERIDTQVMKVDGKKSLVGVPSSCGGFLCRPWRLSRGAAYIAVWDKSQMNRKREERVAERQTERNRGGQL